ncbi:MAG: hypothetical protein ACREMO_04290 [Gemmatimonadales bacterium]
MNSINEFALLFVVVAPIAVLFAMNLFLALEGERGTLMLPSWESPEGQAGALLMAQAPANEAQFRRTA